MELATLMARLAEMMDTEPSSAEPTAVRPALPPAPRSLSVPDGEALPPGLIPYVVRAFQPGATRESPPRWKDVTVYFRGEGIPSESQCRRLSSALRGWRVQSINRWKPAAHPAPKGFGTVKLPPEPKRASLQWVVRLTRGAAPHKRRVLLMRAAARPTLDEARAAVRAAKLVGWRVACVLSPAEHKGQGFQEPAPMYG